ncbi:hypothetical protein MKX03_029504, partial [Papaver bracteatum]
MIQGMILIYATLKPSTKYQPLDHPMGPKQQAVFIPLTYSALQVLSFAEDLLTNLPTFYNLIQLEVLSVVKYYAHKTLFPLIQMAPNLESLVFCK